MTKLLILLSLLALHAHATEEFTCRNSNNEPVDWFIILKAPGGTHYAYCDINDCSEFQFPETLLDDIETSPLMLTLAQNTNLKSEEYGTLLFNDQPPDQKHKHKHGHTKGVLAFKNQQGYYLNHSTPKFPVVSEDLSELILEINSSQTKYGQHYFCMSADLETLEKVAQQMRINYVDYFAGNVPEQFSNNQQSDFYHIMAENDLKIDFGISKIYTSGGQELMSFAKHRGHKVSFYDEVVAPQLHSGMRFETWGRPLMDASCDNDHGLDVFANLYITIKEGSDIWDYRYTKDHSKYGITLDSSKPYVCFGDVNRMTSQHKRGGGTTCIKHADAHKLFTSFMTDMQGCEVESGLFAGLQGVWEGYMEDSEGFLNKDSQVHDDKDSLWRQIFGY